jgi:NADH:ubiquinone oxidoreductase subunit C
MIREKVDEFRDLRLIAIVACKEKRNFILTYYFDDNGKVRTLEFKVSRRKPVVESIVDIFPNADYYEREIYELFGIKFKGNPNLHLKLFLPDEWKRKPPMV